MIRIRRPKYRRAVSFLALRVGKGKIGVGIFSKKRFRFREPLFVRIVFACTVCSISTCGVFESVGCIRTRPNSEAACFPAHSYILRFVYT